MTNPEASPHAKSKNVIKAIELLAQKQLDPKDVLDLAKQLKGERAFGYGRKLLAHALEHPAYEPDERLRLKLSQLRALCTYKDPDLPHDSRLDEAFKILNEADPLAKSNDHETLGLAGAIYKRKWEFGSQKQNLERSLAYYRRGYFLSRDAGWDKDYGYTAINTAFVLDLLAVQEKNEAVKAGAFSDMAAERFAEADVVRKDIVTGVLPLSEQDPKLATAWWYLVTVGEAFFGLGEFKQALVWFKKAAALPNVPGWERESTARQLACLLSLRRQRGEEDATGEEGEKVLRDFLGDDAANSVLIGKIGLALSGGGFRASLYHIGVLARLAELDVLRHVEVLSCVSGGSIIGAHYYLEIRKLLQTKSQAQITGQDYVNIVQRIEKDFLAGVQTNIRVSVVANPLAVLKMIVWPGYSRTNRLGELYENRLFAKVKDGEEKRDRFISRLWIKPVGEREDFSPKEDNWKRTAKVPILILNATTLNTGHNWQFTASWMGEPPAGIDGEIDANLRLRRVYYEDAPDGLKDIRLGYAVAASSCVPGLFEPLPLSGLYQDITVRLVDGGVHDNQGTVGLLDQNCNVLLVSDASGQMSSVQQPDNGLFNVLFRSKSILEERVRIAQYHDLDTRRRSSLLQGLMFIHLKKELAVRPVDWVGCQVPSPPRVNKAITGYGINTQYQGALAAIRTDLDSFTDNEAHALMLSGYRMTEKYFSLAMPEWYQKGTTSEPWGFLKINARLGQGQTSECLFKQLRAGAMMAFKVWQLLLPLKILAVILGLGLCYLCYKFWSVQLLTVTLGTILTLLISVIVNRVFGPWVWKLLNYSKTLKEIGLGIVLVVIGLLAAWIHLLIFDRMYLKQGRK